MCCKLIGVAALNKPSMKWCDLCTPGSGCNIYPERPNECAAFFCEYLLRGELDEIWHPARSKMVLMYRKAVNAIAVYVDPTEPENWRNAPYYAQIKAWVEAIYRNKGQVIIWEGKEAIAVMPGHEKRLGPVQPGQRIAILQKTTPTGTIYDARVLG
jgi:hypothetical protein